MKQYDVIALGELLIDFTDYADLFDKYETLEDLKCDHAVVEH